MANLSTLTQKERDVLLLLTKGLQSKQMGVLLGVSSYTVKQHLKNIYQKLGINSRCEAVMWLLQELYPTIIEIENIKNDINKALLKKVA